MKTFLTLLLTALCCVPYFSHAQTQMDLPVTFDEADVDYGLISFEGAASAIEVDPTDANNMVARVLKDVNAQGVAGTTVTAAAELGFLNLISFTSTETKMTVRVWSPDAGIQVRLKVENHNDPGQSVETEATTTMAGAWETLTFDFANQATGTAAINPAFSYDKATIFFNFLVDGATAGEKTYYFDDMAFEGDGGGGSDDVLILPLDFESSTLDYTFTGFDGGEVTIIDNPQSNGANTSSKVGQMVKSAGEVFGGASISLAAPISFSNNNTFTLKVYSPRANAKLLLKVENATNAGISFQQEEIITTANTWEELTFDYDAIDNGEEYQNLVLIFDDGTMGDGSADFTFLFDDIQLATDDGGGEIDPTQMDLPVTFDDPDIIYGLIGFEGTETSTVEVDPTDANNMVAKFLRSASAGTVAGTTVTAPEELGFSRKIPFTNESTKMNVRVWSPDAGVLVRLKVEDHSDPGKSVETEATITKAGEWQVLTFDFANQAGGTAALDLSFNYDKATIFFNFGAEGAALGEKIYYFDDMAFGAGPDTGGGGDEVSENAPTLPIDFESTTLDYTFSGFGGGEAALIDNPQADGINTSAKVIEMIKGEGEVFGGAFINLIAPIDFTDNTTFKVKVNAPRAFAKLLVKVENLSDGAINFEQGATVVNANTWEELSFDFSGINKANEYQKLVFIFDLGVEGDGSADFTYLFDDVRLIEDDGSGGEDQTQMDLPVTFDESGIDYGLISFEGAAASVVADPTDASNQVAQFVKDANAQGVAGTTLSALSGSGFKNPIPFTASDTHMSVRVWSPDAGIPVRLKVENSNDPGQSVETEAMTTTAGDWETLAFDFSNEATGTATLNPAFVYNKATIFFNFLVDGATAGAKTYYFDDMVFGVAEKMDQTISFASIPDKTLGDGSFNLAATTSSGLAVSYATSSSQIVINGIEVGLLSAGRATITASQAGSSGFNAAAPVAQSFCVQPRQPAITSGTVGTAITLTSSATSGNQWFLDGQAIAGATGVTYEAISSGDYTVQVSVDDCVSAVSEAVSLLVTGDLSGPLEGARIYPNPVTQYLEVKGLTGTLTKVQMLTTAGATHPLVFEKTTDSYRALVAHLPAGMYVLTLQAGNKLYQFKVLKQ